jgi:hypothetical protein
MVLASTVIVYSESHVTYARILLSDGSGSVQSIILVLKAKFLLNNI